MTSPRTRRAAIALALVVVLGLGAPVHAAGRGSWTLSPNWLDHALSWIARLWRGNEPAPTPARIKSDQGNGIDPNGTTTTQSHADPETEKGYGIDPNG